MHNEFYVKEKIQREKEISKREDDSAAENIVNTWKIQKFEVDSDRCSYRLNLKHHLDCYTHFEYYHRQETNNVCLNCTFITWESADCGGSWFWILCEHVWDISSYDNVVSWMNNRLRKR